MKKQSLLFFSLRDLLLVLLLSSYLFVKADVSTTNAPICSADIGGEDPNLQEMVFDIGYGTEYFKAYVQPNLTSMMQSTVPVTVKKPSFTGLAVKIFNMSPDKVLMYWDPMDGRDPSLLATLLPFFTSGTASFPGHNFLITPLNYDPKKNPKVLKRILVYQGVCNYYYDPLEVSGDDAETQKNLATLTLKQYEMYEKMKRTQKFNIQYKAFTGREYLSHYPRNPPKHFMWRADYFGQTHWVTTKEVHFKEIPAEKDLRTIDTYGKQRMLRDDQSRFLAQYRVDEPILNMTLKVLSVAPRAFEIRGFLSEPEVDHIQRLSGILNLSRSKTGDSINANDDSETRTSFNTWITREQDHVIDAIYRRTSDLLRIDEALLRYRGDGEHSDLDTQSSIAESLQLVRYRDGQEYTAHHDFGFSDVDDELQPARYATVLFYLNDGMVGGETEFPRWVNGVTHDGLKVTPEKGKAVLFYNQLPDGNMDDLSEHAALPVTQGTKLLTNLWVWDPVYEH